jgi:hypothetical protein
MESTRIQLRPVLVAGALIIGLTVVSPLLNAAATVWLISFTIDDGYPVKGDGLTAPGDIPGTYKDYRLGTGQPDDVNYCLEASPSANLLFIRLNRKLDGDSGTQYCGRNGGSPRQFFVTINDDTACSELWSHGYNFYVDPQGQRQETGPDAPCIFTGADKPRIRISNDPYARQTTTTPVGFLSKWYDESLTSYELRTETNAVVEKAGLDPSMRIVRYSGTARLWRFEPGVREGAVTQPFALPFHITLRRTSQ